MGAMVAMVVVRRGSNKKERLFWEERNARGKRHLEGK
jgi:hypothetical protein